MVSQTVIGRTPPFFLELGTEGLTATGKVVIGDIGLTSRGPQLFTILYSLLEILTYSLQSLSALQSLNTISL